MNGRVSRGGSMQRIKRRTRGYRPCDCCDTEAAAGGALSSIA